MIPILTRLLLVTVCLGLAVPTGAGELDDERGRFLAARKALNEGKTAQFEKLADGLRDYPLYPYLRYAWLSKRLSLKREPEIREFLDAWEDVPVSTLLRNAWLRRLVRAGRWQSFLEYYRDTDSVKLQCQALHARIRTKRTEGIIDDTRRLWLVGKSQPSECDPAFEHLYANGGVDDDLVWQRIRLAMAKGQTSLAVFLSRRLDAEDQQWVVKWQKAHLNPVWHLRHTRWQDQPVVREIYLHAVKRAVRSNPARADELWQELKKRHDFSPQQASDAERAIALRAAYTGHPDAWQWIGRYREAKDDDIIREWRIRTALAAEDWQAVRTSIEQLPYEERMSTRWRYWRANALLNTGDTQRANLLFRRIAKSRDYYGFLAADRLGLDYTLDDQPIHWTQPEIDALLDIPGILRARELFLAGQLTDARREWREVIRQLDTRQLQLASVLASQIGWHDRAILTVAQSDHFDDLKLRFPIRFSEHIEKSASSNRLDPAWVYGVIRQESVFMHDARSSAGARGLMQIMPSTGRAIARKLGIKRFSIANLYEPARNIHFGTSYLRQMLDRFDDNMVLATAAYNAGPLRVDKWLPKAGCQRPDIWAERVPFTETRNYLSRVMAYSVIYDWRLTDRAGRVSQRMRNIGVGGKSRKPGKPGKDGECQASGTGHIMIGDETASSDNGV